MFKQVRVIPNEHTLIVPKASTVPNIFVHYYQLLSNFSPIGPPQNVKFFINASTQAGPWSGGFGADELAAI